MGDVLEEDEEREERRAIPAVGVDVSYGLFRISLRIFDRATARTVLTGFGIGFGAVVGAYYLRNSQLVMGAVRSALETTAGLQVGTVTPGSILVELICSTDKSFISFMEDFETKEVARRLNKEFKNTGYNGELEVTIINKKEAYKHLEKIRETGTTCTRTGDERKAIPLCLPNNCKWNSQAREYTKTEDQRSSLYVVEEAIEKLRKVKGPVCVVSIAGPCRYGKSYILSEAFDQPDVFPLGYELVAETMGIWLWIVPEKYKDSNGQEFTVVLLDSEGIDAVSSIGYDDNQIFTLTVLLASVLIYNSQGVPMRRDLEGLDFITKLPQRIQVRSHQGVGVKQKETELFRRTFPHFIWLLRDLTQAIPRDCKDLKDYFLKKVFEVPDSSSASPNDHQEVPKSILHLFSDFEAFSLPPPAFDPEILKSLNDNKSRINPLFFIGLEAFKRLLGDILTPKKSFIEGELVTGEGLAALVELYVQAINSPGVIPNVPNAWETFVEMKCCEVIRGALENYENVMKSKLKDKLPCDNDDLRKVHGTAIKESKAYFEAETEWFCRNTIEKYLNKTKELLSEMLIAWQTENAKLTRKSCNDLLTQLKQNHVDPVLRRLQGKEAAKMSFEEVIAGYNKVNEDYHNSAIGAKDVIHAVFFEFQPALSKELEQYLRFLGQLKGYDEVLTQEIPAIKAYQEQERQRLQEERGRLLQENLEVKKEMEMLRRKLDEERKKFSQQMKYELQAQTEKLTKDHEDIIAKMEAKHKEEQERLRHEIEAAQARFRQLGEELEKQLEEPPSWFQRFLSNVSVNFQINASV